MLLFVYLEQLDVMYTEATESLILDDTTGKKFIPVLKCPVDLEYMPFASFDTSYSSTAETVRASRK